MYSIYTVKKFYTYFTTIAVRNFEIHCVIDINFHAFIKINFLYCN